MTLLSVPIIDLTPFRTGADKPGVAAAVAQACRDIGFLVVTGHGVDPALIQRVSAVSTAFFDLPLEEKTAVARPAPDVTRGYIPMLGESVARSRGEAAPGDLNESMMIGPVAAFDPADPYYTGPAAGKHFWPNLWPERPAELRPLWTAYFNEMERLAGEIMRAFALALDLPEAFFDDKIDRHISRLRVRNYPAPTTPPVPGQLRAGAHTDYGSLTILHTEDKPGGLQVVNKAGEWVDVPIVPGCFIINIGDLMMRWTNDTWTSNLHRVVNPPLDAGEASRRQSLVFFHNPNHDALVECIPSCLAPGAAPKYPPITSGDYLRLKFTQTQTAYAAE